MLSKIHICLHLKCEIKLVISLYSCIEMVVVVVVVVENQNKMKVDETRKTSSKEL